MFTIFTSRQNKFHPLPIFETMMINRLFLLFVFVMFLVPTENVWAIGESFAGGAAVTQPDIYARPGNYRAGVRDAVWDAALNPQSNRVHDPLTGKFIGRKAAWDMGHKPGWEYSKLKEVARQRSIPRRLLLVEHNNPAHYRPELPSSNRSHKLEAPKKINSYKIRGYGKFAKFKPAAIAAKSVKYGTMGSAVTVNKVKFIKFATKAGGVLAIVAGAFDIGYGGYAYYTAHQRYLAGELDWDIAAGKKVLAVGHVILGSGAITVGVLLLIAPEAVFTKAAGIALLVAGVTYIIVDLILDNYLERLQAKRTQQRQETLARISWEARQDVCIKQLREMI